MAMSLPISFLKNKKEIDLKEVIRSVKAACFNQVSVMTELQLKLRTSDYLVNLFSSLYNRTNSKTSIGHFASARYEPSQTPQWQPPSKNTSNTANGADLVSPLKFC